MAALASVEYQCSPTNGPFFPGRSARCHKLAFTSLHCSISNYTLKGEITTKLARPPFGSAGRRFLLSLPLPLHSPFLLSSLLSRQTHGKTLVTQVKYLNGRQFLHIKDIGLVQVFD